MLRITLILNMFKQDRKKKNHLTSSWSITFTKYFSQAFQMYALLTFLSSHKSKRAELKYSQLRGG